MHVLWGVVVLRVALRHIPSEAVLAELRRNEGLRRIIGIESEAGVPKPWNVSRFEDVLGLEPHRTLLKEVFDVLIRRLGAAVADLGRNTAGDATALSARRRPSYRNARPGPGPIGSPGVSSRAPSDVHLPAHQSFAHASICVSS